MPKFPSAKFSSRVPATRRRAASLWTSLAAAAIVGFGAFAALLFSMLGIALGKIIS